jgi:hypothetical protein
MSEQLMQNRNEANLKDEINRLNNDLEELSNRLVNMVYNLEKSHCNLILSIDPNVTVKLDKMVSKPVNNQN